MTGVPIYKTKYKSPMDVPDKYIRNFSPRDPNNKFYQSRKWYDIKKRQIFFSQNDGVPLYLRTPRWKAFYYGTWTFNIFVAGYAMYRFIQLTDGKTK